MARGHIETRHLKACRESKGKRCVCKPGPSYRAKLSDPDTGQRIPPKTFPSREAAERWIREALTALDVGVRPQGTGPTTTVAEYADELVERMRDGRTLDRSGERYRPATIRGYEGTIRNYLKPSKLGPMRLRDVRRRHVQEWIDELRLRGLAGSTIGNKLDPLRVIVRLAIDREDITTDPCHKLRLPAVRPKTRAVADPARADKLLAALPDHLRALWTVLFFCGLRMGEARALRWSDVDLTAGELRVDRGWDDAEGEQEDPKTEAGRRVVPVTGPVRAELVRHKLATGRGGSDLVFGRSATEAFVRSTIRHHSLKAWGWKTVQENGRRTTVKARPDALEPLTPHEARHTCASYLVAAGADDFLLSKVIGHTDPRFTKRVYAHLFPDDVQRVGKALDAFLESRQEAR